MENLKQVVAENIVRAKNRKDTYLRKTPEDTRTIRYCEGYIAALESIVFLLPDDSIKLYDQMQLDFGGVID